jgi:hypothetical protein
MCSQRQVLFGARNEVKGRSGLAMEGKKSVTLHSQQGTDVDLSAAISHNTLSPPVPPAIAEDQPYPTMLSPENIISRSCAR